MKKSIMMMTTALLLCNAVFAQKYMTRTGKVSFFEDASLMKPAQTAKAGAA